MYDSIQLTATDGHRLAAYVAEPTGKPRGALVVVQEVFGVNSHIRAVADGFAADGYRCIAPALFDRVEPGVEIGYTPEDIKRGIELRAGCTREAALLDIGAALAHVASAGRAGIVGYCWGGTLAFVSACELDGLSAAVSYYGGGIAEVANAKPKCPVMAHFGESDASIPMTAVDTFRAAQPQAEVHLYPAGHGFNCDQRGSYDAASAKLARERTLRFFQSHVG